MSHTALDQSISRRDCLALGGLAAASLALPNTARSDDHRAPNIILIMTDDQGWGDIHSHGNEVIRTPVLDALAAEGARFDRFYVSPVCAPTRASLLTGRYAMRTGVHGVTRGYETMRADEVTLAEVCKQNGYATGCFGKWHNGAHYPQHPNGQGFDEFLGFCAGHWNNYFDPKLEHNGAPIREEGYITDVLTDAAIQFIEDNQDQPFFCYIPYNAPHSPWQVPDRYFDYYKSKGLDDKTACAYAMCENIDENVGRVLQRLEELGLEGDTLVMFLTDNGANSDRYDGHMRGRKGAVDEGGVRVPFFVRWPGKIAAGQTIEPIAAHIDVLPTLTQLCGFENPQTKPLDGISLAPLLVNQPENWPDRKIFSHWGGRGAVRTQRWRATVTRQGAWSLYDIENDPRQETDLAESNQGRLAELRAAYEDWYEDVTQEGFEPIPIEIGHAESPTVTLPGHEAFLQPGRGEGIDYYGGAGWANDWVAKWTDAQAFPSWEIDVVRGGTYAVSMLYICDEGSVGTSLRLEILDQTLTAQIGEAYNPPVKSHPDRVPRKEVYEREWAEIPVGEVKLQPGQGRLRVKVTEMPGDEAIHLKAVRLKRI